MREQSAARRIQETLPLLRQLIDRLTRSQEFPFEYAGSTVELAEHIQIILGGGKVPAYHAASETKRGDAR